MERLEFAGRPPLEGLIESEDRDWITLIQIRRPPGRPMYLVIRPIDRASVCNVVRLKPAQREALRRQIEAFRNRAAIEAGRMEAVRLETAEADGNRYQRYRGRWFTLDSTAGEAMTRRVIVRTEQIFTAYRQILPPRTAPESRRAWSSWPRWPATRHSSAGWGFTCRTGRVSWKRRTWWWPAASWSGWWRRRP